MRQEHAEDLYPLYDRFIQEFLIEGNSILTNHKNILTKETIDYCYKNFILKPIHKGNFFDKIAIQFKGSNEETKLVFAHIKWLWAFAVDDILDTTKRSYVKKITSLEDSELKQDVYPRGFGSAGQWHTNKKYGEISFLLQIIKFLDDNNIKDIQEIKNWIEHICLYKKYELETPEYPISQVVKDFCEGYKVAMTNILTYVGNPDKYERIASDNHKEHIISSFWSLLKEEEYELNFDEKIQAIRNQLTEFTRPNFDFYEWDYKRIWNYSLSEEGFSEIQGLQYKKAIILYGPPGTSKTHSAKHLASALITHGYLKDKTNVATYFKEEPNLTKDRIHHLQLHPNYTYEDFIAGYQLKDNNTEKTKGTLFEICKKASEDKEMPHVLILDEINRIDLSRLFGEVFSALENRNEAIEVSIGGLYLTIPENLYVIGTMNEIDFSLERIDFALRRRFLWFPYGFNKGTLWHIIREKNWQPSKNRNLITKDEEITRFIDNAESLNKEIASIQELGEQYHIGHTFFAEVVDIYKSYKELKGLSSPRKQLYRDDGGAVKILWDISIEPMITSFLGNLEPESRKEILIKLKSVYDK